MRDNVELGIIEPEPDPWADEYTEYIYYSTQRPVSLGTYPKKGMREIVNFDERKFCEEIGREAWGFLRYDRRLDDKEASDYELVGWMVD